MSAAAATGLRGAPSDGQLNRLADVLAPVRRVSAPKLYGAEALPERGALLVGNHTIYGFLDLPVMMVELWNRRGIKLRGLGDHGHYAIPVWRDLLELCGMVRGTRENVRELMAAGENVLVFPGGAGEVFKRKGEKYRLLWKERLGFARLAIEFGYPVVPFAAVGAEEMLDVVADRDTPGYAQLSALTKRLVGMKLPPIVRGIGATPLPRPERLYFWFGERIDTRRFGSDPEADTAARALRDEVRGAVEGGIELLLAQRERDPGRGLTARLRGRTGEPELPAPADPQAEAVRRLLESWNASGAAGAADWLSQRIVLEDPPDWPDKDVWRGRDAAIARLEDVTSALGGIWAEPGELRGVGDQVVGSLTLRTGGSRSGTAIGEFHFVAELDRNQLSRLRVFRSEAEARAAVGGGDWNEAHHARPHFHARRADELQPVEPLP